MASSSQLRLYEVRAVFRLLNEIQERHGEQICWQRHMVLSLCQLLGARQGASLQWEGFSPEGALKLVGFVPEGWACPQAAELWGGAMRRENWRDDPLLDRATRVRGFAVTRSREQLVSDRQYFYNEFTAEMRRMTECDHELVCWFRHGGSDGAHGIALHRNLGDRPFSLRQQALLQLFNEELYRLALQGKLHPVDLTAGLTPRQREVLNSLLLGDSEKEAARRLGVSRFTLNDHVKAIYARLAISSRGELMARFVHRST